MSENSRRYENRGVSLWRRWVGVACAGLLGASLCAQGGEDDATAALRDASRLVKAIKGLEGDERSAAIDRALAAFEAIGNRDQVAAGPRARAYYGAAELLRRKGELERAANAYGKAAELDADAFGERGLSGRAHMLRRLQRWDEALVLYRRVGAMDRQTNRVHEARLWVGRCLLAQDDVEAAVTAFEQGLQAAQRPRHLIETCNWLAKAHLVRGDLGAADAALQRAARAVPAGDSDEARSLQRAVDKMSARRALQRAKDKANGAHDDAIDVERSRRRG